MLPPANSKVVGEVDTPMGAGVYGSNNRGFGVWGTTSDPDKAGVFGQGGVGAGVWGETSAQDHSGVYGESPNGFGIRGKGRLAGLFEGDVQVHGNTDLGGNVQVSGNVEVKGDIVLTGADCAEEFSVEVEGVEAGTVMVIGEGEILHPSSKPYDKRVVGVVSGGGEYRPGLILDKQEGQPGRKPIALLGKAFCKADANDAPIEVGDLLTTSGTAGHAMKISDPTQAFGAVIGKALRALSSGRGLIPILIALQ
jgi:hypothetical protein